MRPPMPAYGNSGCGQDDALSDKRVRFPLACWEMQQNPFGDNEAGEMTALAEFEKMKYVKDASEAQMQYRGTSQEKNWARWYSSRSVPAIHHVKFASVHSLARQTLDPS